MKKDFDISYDQLDKVYGIKKKEAAAFLVMLSLLKPGEIFSTPIGRIEKLSSVTFKIDITEQELEDLAMSLDPFDSITIDDAIFKCKI